MVEMKRRGKRASKTEEYENRREKRREVKNLRNGERGRVREKRKQKWRDIGREKRKEQGGSYFPFKGLPSPLLKELSFLFICSLFLIFSRHYLWDHSFNTGILRGSTPRGLTSLGKKI